MDKEQRVVFEIWNSVPPVSEDHATARDRVLERLARLVEELAPPAREVAAGPPV
jgi:hypothetical protein